MILIYFVFIYEMYQLSSLLDSSEIVPSLASVAGSSSMGLGSFWRK